MLKFSLSVLRISRYLLKRRNQIVVLLVNYYLAKKVKRMELRNVYCKFRVEDGTKDAELRKGKIRTQCLGRPVNWDVTETDLIPTSC